MIEDVEYPTKGWRADAKYYRVVFVVDDEAVIAQTLAVILKQAGFRASPFDHPDKAVAALAQLRT